MFFQSFLFVLLILTSCVSAQPGTAIINSGVIENDSHIYDTSGNQFSIPVLSMKQKAWYKDSLVIEEVCSLKIATDAEGNTKQEIIIEHYRYNDLRKGWIYEYKNFSDTAAIIKKYISHDTVRLVGGWNFIAKRKRKIEYQGVPENLSDTVVDQINYKRVKYLMGKRDNPYFYICYFRCDKKGTLFNYDKSLSDQMGCPLVKLFSFSSTKRVPPTSAQINFLADSLTTEELKVFGAWERNAKKLPINR